MKSIEQHRWESELSAMLGSWYDKIPHVPFNKEWDVRAVPAFGGAIVRYRIQHQGAEVSVYLDAYDRLGCVGEPYWEIYPNPHGECDRFLMNEVGDLVAGIDAAIMAHADHA